MWKYLPRSIYSPDTAASTSPSDSPASNPEPSATSSGTSTVSKSSKPGSKTASLTMPPSGTMSESLTVHPGVEEWISSLPLRPASLIVKPENYVGPATIGTSSPILSESLAKYDRKLCIWKTSQVLMFDQKMDGQLTGQLWSENWPRSGTTVDGTLYPRKMLAHRISENGGGLWPTPVADGDRAKGWSIPTPTPSDNWTGNLASSQQSDDSMHSVTLPGFVARFPTSTTEVRYNTPNTMDGMAPKSQKALDHEHDTARPGRKNPNNLRDQVAVQEGLRLWPTPHASCSTGTGTQGREGGMNLQTAAHEPAVNGQLSATWVCWLMGLPLGWDSLDPLPEGAYAEWLEHMEQGTWWAEERGLPRLAEGQKDRVNRLKCLGNGIVPASGALAFITLEGE